MVDYWRDIAWTRASGVFLFVISGPSADANDVRPNSGDKGRLSGISANSHVASKLSPSQSGQMKVREVLRILKDDGWVTVRTRGSHRQLRHRVKSGRVTVPGKLSDDLAPGTLNSILKQADLKIE